MQNQLLHITSSQRWMEATGGYYSDPSLATEGFIHCSTAAQVLLPANERFRGQSDLILLCIDPTKLDCPLVFEDCYESGMEFPHLYGPLLVSAVTTVVDFPPNPDGTFDLPGALAPD